MELFKAVEKEQKTKAFSKEGLAGTAKLDPKEREKEEMSSFLADMVDDLERQVEAKEAEVEQIQVKKGKKDTAKDKNRIEELETIMERHKWHQSRLELLNRALANDAVEPEQVKKVEDGIRYYVGSNEEVDFYEDELLYDDFNLDEEEGKYGLAHDVDHQSSQDNQSVLDETPELASASIDTIKAKTKDAPVVAQARRPSIQMKSPLPSLATLHTLPTASTIAIAAAMKPAPPPSKPMGEPLKYASAAAAAAAADRAGVGIAPLPPPPSASGGINTALPTTSSSPSATNSPAVPTAQLAKPPTLDKSHVTSTIQAEKPASRTLTPALSHTSANAASLSPGPGSAQLLQNSTTDDVPSAAAQTRQAINEVTKALDGLVVQNHERNNENAPPAAEPAPQADGMPFDAAADSDGESVYHLPAALQELVDSYEAVKTSAPAIGSAEHSHYLAESFRNRPDNFDAERPRHYKPENPALYTPPHYPHEPLPLFDDPRLYGKIDTDALFYSFYYRQGTYQQYLAAKALRGLSWRFHKQYQTWFQRHEEPKHISEDYEQGTYRFFDYESTW